MSGEYQREFVWDASPPEIRDGMRGRLRTTREVKEFALAGCAYFTIRSRRTGQRFTYRVAPPSDRRPGSPPIYFVKVLTGPDNRQDFEYLGQIRDDLDYDHGRKSRISSVAPSADAFRWLWRSVVRPERDELMDYVEVWHEGRCCRCGRKLTVPESVERGVGPECLKTMGGA